ncbi:MAG: hypothetical protein A2V83_11165 [Nitrospirae bacterium RBG_16_64_22]|nr:MAG: hypothetical protein A2V83_11165 [Nitrospirae bacterium RBG_16_64_22]
MAGYLEQAKRVLRDTTYDKSRPALAEDRAGEVLPLPEARRVSPGPGTQARSHGLAIKVHSEVLGADLWIVLDPADTKPDPGKYDAPVYSRREVERLVEMSQRGELHPDQLRVLHKAKQTWPGIKVQDGPEAAHDVAPQDAIGNRADVEHTPEKGETNERL